MNKQLTLTHSWCKWILWPQSTNIYFLHANYLIAIFTLILNATIVKVIEKFRHVYMQYRITIEFIQCRKIRLPVDIQELITVAEWGIRLLETKASDKESLHCAREIAPEILAHDC